MGTAYEPEPQGTTDIVGENGVVVDLDDFTFEGRDSTDATRSGATIQETVDALNAENIMVIGLGSDGSQYSSEPKSLLKGYSKVTDGVLPAEADTIVEEDETLLVDREKPLYFTIEDHEEEDDIGEHISDAIRALVEFHPISGEISGHVFFDTSGNGAYDDGEPQPSGLPVYASLNGLGPASAL